jgi:hypothetical protein
MSACYDDTKDTCSFEDWKDEVRRLAESAGCDPASGWLLFDGLWLRPAYCNGLSPLAYVTSEGRKHGYTILRGGPGQPVIIPQGGPVYTGDM